VHILRWLNSWSPRRGRIRLRRGRAPLAAGPFPRSDRVARVRVQRQRRDRSGLQPTAGQGRIGLCQALLGCSAPEEYLVNDQPRSGTCNRGQTVVPGSFGVAEVVVDADGAIGVEIDRGLRAGRLIPAGEGTYEVVDAQGQPSRAELVLQGQRAREDLPELWPLSVRCSASLRPRSRSPESRRRGTTQRRTPQTTRAVPLSRDVARRRPRS
jgi:hypothetical protein